jgi:hypothetical protein|nr:MAG TPA: hypothetical protein [Caudoviricetes sp.]
MKIEKGYYLKMRNGFVGYISAVLKTDSEENHAFEYTITHPEIGKYAFFVGSEKEMWRMFHTVGTASIPIVAEEKSDKAKCSLEKRIKPFSLVKKEQRECWKIQTDRHGGVTKDFGMHDIYLKDIPDNERLALKINEIIEVLNGMIDKDGN